MTILTYSCGHTFGQPERIHYPCRNCDKRGGYKDVQSPPRTFEESRVVRLATGGATNIQPGMVLDRVPTRAEERAALVRECRERVLDGAWRFDVGEERENNMGRRACDMADNELVNARVRLSLTTTKPEA